MQHRSRDVPTAQAAQPRETRSLRGAGVDYIVGVVLALSVAAFATLAGFDRDRSFYPTVTIVIAAYYGLFAVLGGSPRALTIETASIGVFFAMSLIGFHYNLWWIVAALAAHGAFDWYHADLIADPGVPPWWPGFCLAYDVTAAAYLAWLLGSSRLAFKAAASR